MEKKKEVLIVFPTREGGLNFFKEHFSDNMVTKMKDRYTYESDICTFRILNFDLSGLRGRRNVDFIYLYEDFPLSEYLASILPLVEDDSRVRVVI
jgi:hypothetical protein